MDINTKMAQSIVGTSPGRDKKRDFYPTPERATRALLKVEDFHSWIWECACGDGAISKVLREMGFSTLDTDLYDYGFGRSGIDFLTSEEPYLRDYNIITNPPFILAEKFVIKAMSLKTRKFAFLAKLAFLEGQKRSKLLQSTPLKNVWVFEKRLTMTRNGEPQRSTGMIAFAWFVWEKDYSGRPMIGWI